MKLAIMGAAGFAREAADVAIACGYDDLVFLDRQPQVDAIHGFRVDRESAAPALAEAGFAFVIGIADGTLRRRVFERYSSFRYANLFHPAATFGHLQKERFEGTRGNVVAAGARLMNSISVGDFGIYSVNCTIGHDCLIEDFTTVMPGANVSGNVHLREGAYLGTNCAVLQGRPGAPLVVGRSSVVGAGAVVVKDVPDGETVKGVPAK